MLIPLLLATTILISSPTPSIQTSRKQVILEYKNRIQETQQKREEYRQEFQNKLSQVADERKRLVSGNLEEKIQQTNANWVEKFGEALTRIEAVLNKVEEKSGDTDAVINAKNKLNAAKEAVNTQAAKTYTINFDSEDNLGQAIRKTISQLHQDLKTTRQAVQDAKQAVVAAVREWNNSQENE